MAKKHGKIESVSCPQGMKGQGFSCSKRGDGFVINTHRAASKIYPTLEEIPQSVRKFIESTG